MASKKNNTQNMSTPYEISLAKEFDDLNDDDFMVWLQDKEVQSIFEEHKIEKPISKEDFISQANNYSEEFKRALI